MRGNFVNFGGYLFIGFKFNVIVILLALIVLKSDVIFVKFFDRVILLKIMGFREKKRGLRK
jgi:hypothetical protein